jgi:DNA-binding CsgD family transcriptional regulator
VRGALARARRGTGELVLIEGPSGIGKSRLLSAAAAEAAASEMELLQAHGLQLDRDASFGLAQELFMPRLIDDGARRRLLTGQAALAGSVFDSAYAPPTDPRAAVRGLYWLAVNLAGPSPTSESARPLAVLVDDAQWSDRPSLSFLVHLASRLDGLPVSLLVCVRTGESERVDDALRSLHDVPGCTVLTPRALSHEAVGWLVEDELPGAEPEFVAACARVSAGNPFMTRELARALRMDAVPPTLASVPRVEQLVPASVLRSLLGRLGRLGEAARRIATAVAVLGDGASLRHAATLAEVEPRDGERAADALARAEILEPGEPMRFVHPLIATAVASDLQAFARARAHRAAAELLHAEGAPVAEVAAHLQLSRPVGDEWALDTVRAAAHQALVQGDPDAAVRLLSRALAEPPPKSRRGAVLLELAEAEVVAGDAAAGVHIAEALALLEDAAGRSRALRTLSRVKLAAADHPGAAEAILQALDEADPRDPVREQMLVEYLTVATFNPALSPDAVARLAPMVDAARRGSPSGGPGLLAHVAFRLALSGDPAARVSELAELATAGDPLVDPVTYGMPMGLIVQALCSVDDLDTAERIADAALAAARERGSLIAAATASFHRAIPRYHRGALADALVDLDQAQAASREGWGGGQGWTRALLAQVLLERGELDSARATVAFTPAPDPQTMDGMVLVCARARVALAERDPASALALAVSAGRGLADRFGIDHPGLVPWRHTAAAAALALDDVAQARDLAREAVQMAGRLRVARVTGMALRTAAAVAGHEERISLLTQAAGVLTDSPSTLELCHVLSELGHALRRAGQRSDAQEPLRQALQLADRMGAHALAEATLAELQATGARPRRAAITGRDALTPAERRVAQLAAGGLSNPQIAQDLFVTIKTVQTHLAHAYRKLGISSRRQLRTALEEQPQL